MQCTTVGELPQELVKVLIASTLTQELVMDPSTRVRLDRSGRPDALFAPNGAVVGTQTIKEFWAEQKQAQGRRRRQAIVENGGLEPDAPTLVKLALPEPPVAEAEEVAEPDPEPEPVMEPEEQEAIEVNLSEVLGELGTQLDELETQIETEASTIERLLPAYQQAQRELEEARERFKASPERAELEKEWAHQVQLHHATLTAVKARREQLLDRAARLPAAQARVHQLCREAGEQVNHHYNDVFEGLKRRKMDLESEVMGPLHARILAIEEEAREAGLMGLLVTTVEAKTA